MGKPVRSLFLSKIEENHMEETNVTMTTEKTQGEPAAKENETKAEKFIRIGEYRMNKAVEMCIRDRHRLMQHMMR